jgi:hypothetical protein
MLSYKHVTVKNKYKEVSIFRTIRCWTLCMVSKNICFLELDPFLSLGKRMGRHPLLSVTGCTCTYNSTVICWCSMSASLVQQLKIALSIRLNEVISFTQENVVDMHSASSLTLAITAGVKHTHNVKNISLYYLLSTGHHLLGVLFITSLKVKFMHSSTAHNTK